MEIQKENEVKETIKKSAVKKKKYAMGIKIAALLCIILFFFPMCTISCSVYGETYEENLSGWDCAVGKEIFDGDGTVDPHPFAFALLVIPVVLLIVTLTNRSKAGIAGTLMGIAQIVALLVFRNSIIDYVNTEGEGMFDLTFTSWFTVNIISAGIAVLLGGLDLTGIRLTHEDDRYGE